VPPPLIAAFAECYGEELTSQLALRAPIQLQDRRLVVGTESRALESDDSDELLAHYVEIVSRLRQSQAGQPIALRADDLVALSSALGQDSKHVEARIVDILGCTPYEAHSLHSEMLRRKLVLPLAGLVAGIAMVSGAGMAHASSATPVPAPDSVSHVAAAHIAAGHIAAGNVVTTVVAPPTTVVEKQAESTPTVTEPEAPAAETPAAETSEAEAPAPETPATEAPAAEAPAPEAADAPVAEAQAPMPPPVIEPDDTPMGIPPNETVTIISP